MSDNDIMYYNSSSVENDQTWADNDDLAVLMNAAADADARDTEEALNKKRLIEEASNEDPSQDDTVSTTRHIPDDINNREYVNTSSNGYYGEKHDNEVSFRRGTKRKHEDNDDRKGERDSSSEAHAAVVAAHYNTLEDKGLDERLKSRIFYMRNFNNWIKSMLINEYLTKVKDDLKHNSAIRVMDMCCGKGGDLLKWRKGNITYLICTDIASVSLEQCESRYNEMCARSARERNAGRVYKAEFISADCTKVRLREKYRDPSIKLDLVSCQFAFHYSFESLPQAECMLRNAAECLQEGGYFIGTMPDANVIVARQRRTGSTAFGNDVYQIKFQCDTKMPPLFGAKYNFHLDGVVDCPEFLVNFPAFVKLARKFGLQLVRVETFPDFFERMKGDGMSLLQKMQCLETYPPNQGASLFGNDNDYTHAAEYRDQQNNVRDRLGTLSLSEWEAVSLYLTFAFKKAKTIWGPNSEPQYEFS